MARTLVLSALAIFACVSLFLLMTGPNEVSLTNLPSLLFGSLTISIGICVCIAWVIACCMVAKRLGYDQGSGLLLLVPVINVFVFFYWAFQESPNERKIRSLARKQESRK